MSVASTSGATHAKMAATTATGSAYLDRVARRRPAMASAAADAMSGSSAVTTTCGKVAHVDLRLLPQQQLKVTPKQIAANYILQLSSLELQDVINQELEENPALDLEEVQVCPLCGNHLTGRVRLNCFGASKAGAAEQYGDSEPLEGTSLMARDEEGGD